MKRLEERIAIVTGAYRGIGLGIAKVLARHGAYVVLTDATDKVKDSAEAIRKAGFNAIAFKMDVTKRQDVDETVQKVLEKFGKIDILVNSAGIYPRKDLVDMSDEFVYMNFNVNVFGMFRCAGAVLPSMMKKRYGKIVNMSSTTGPIVADPAGGWTAYAATKAAVWGLTTSLALEVAQYGINVNCVCPGSIDTPGARESDPSAVKNLGPSIPMCRLGTPEEVGDVVLFLASDESKYITGTHIVIDGGNTIQEFFHGPYTPK